MTAPEIYTEAGKQAPQDTPEQRRHHTYTPSVMLRYEEKVEQSVFVFLLHFRRYAACRSLPACAH
jgi:hypothetical protein